MAWRNDYTVRRYTGPNSGLGGLREQNGRSIGYFYRSGEAPFGYPFPRAGAGGVGLPYSPACNGGYGNPSDAASRVNGTTVDRMKAHAEEER